LSRLIVVPFGPGRCIAAIAALRSGAIGWLVASAMQVALGERMCVSCPNGETGPDTIGFEKPLFATLATSIARKPSRPIETNTYSPRFWMHWTGALVPWTMLRNSSSGCVSPERLRSKLRPRVQLISSRLFRSTWSR
jgi:hypothetical protein